MSLDVAAYEATAATRELDRFGVDLPPDAARWLQRLVELRESRPVDEPHNAIAQLIADGAKPADIDRAIAKRLGQALRSGQHGHAQQLCGQRILNAILADRTRLHRELSATADDLIDRLHRAAEVDESVVELTRAKRVEEAHLVATADSDAGELLDLFKVREEYLTPAGSRWSTGWWNCSQLRNPWDCENRSSDDGTQWSRWRAMIRAGGQLWYPTFEQAVEVSSEREPGNILPPIPVTRASFVSG